MARLPQASDGVRPLRDGGAGGCVFRGRRRSLSKCHAPSGRRAFGSELLPRRLSFPGARPVARGSTKLGALGGAGFGALRARIAAGPRSSRTGRSGGTVCRGRALAPSRSAGGGAPTSNRVLLELRARARVEVFSQIDANVGKQ